MNETLEYRKILLDRLLATSYEFRDRCMQLKDVNAPLEPGGWTYHQMITHVRDVEQHVYGLRARRILNEAEMPIFQNFDADAWMAKHYDPNEPAQKMLADFIARIEELINSLSELPVEAWSKPGRHVQLGEKTLQWWIERSLAHVEEHLEVVKK